MHTLNIGAHCTRVNHPTIDPDFIIGIDNHENVRILRFRLRNWSVRPVYVNSRFLNE